MPGQKMDGLFKGWCLFKISYTEETETGRDAGRDRERYPLMLMSVLRVMCFNVTCVPILCPSQPLLLGTLGGYSGVGSPLNSILFCSTHRGRVKYGWEISTCQVAPTTGDESSG